MKGKETFAEKPKLRECIARSVLRAMLKSVLKAVDMTGDGKLQPAG